MFRRLLVLGHVTLAAASLLGCSAAADPFKPAEPSKAAASIAADQKTVPANDHAGSDALDRTALPIPEPKFAPITMLDARNASAPPRFEVKAPATAPNVLIVLIDDVGFGQSSAFGGPIHMPTLNRLAKGGLRYNDYKEHDNKFTGQIHQVTVELK